MSLISLVNIHHKVPYDVYIARPYKGLLILGNPYVIGKDGTREEVIVKYREWLLPLLTTPTLQRTEMLRILDLSKTKPIALGCFCYPLLCHGDVIIELLTTGLDLWL